MQNTFKSELQILKENFKFIWDINDKSPETWEETFAKNYYDKLYKEYCISDLSLYKEGKIGLRWCNEKDLLEGKGLKLCGNSECHKSKDLIPYEVNMSYFEEGENKNALVKVFLCKKCGKKLKKSYKYLKRKRKREEIQEKIYEN